MPFDAPQEDSVLANLIKARSYIDTPEKHLMYAYTSMRDGRMVMCSMNAIFLAATGYGAFLVNSPTMEMALLAKHSGVPLELSLGAESAICSANNLGHEHAMKMFDGAIAERRMALAREDETTEQ